jgi:hypothetical protein
VIMPAAWTADRRRSQVQADFWNPTGWVRAHQHAAGALWVSKVGSRHAKTETGRRAERNQRSRGGGRADPSGR